MSVPDFTDPKRIGLTLDPGLVLERLILQRLSVLKRKRGQDWLRSLLVQGFLAEGRWLSRDPHANRSNAVPRETALPATPFASWLGRARPTERPVAEPMRATATAKVKSVGEIPMTNPESKPFAHLRKVIG